MTRVLYKCALLLLVCGLFTAWGVVNKPVDVETVTVNLLLFFISLRY